MNFAEEVNSSSTSVDEQIVYKVDDYGKAVHDWIRRCAARRADLAALMFRVLPRLAALEEPLLRDAGLSMWEYAILTEVSSNAAMSQVELSRRTRAIPLGSDDIWTSWFRGDSSVENGRAISGSALSG